ncbi:MAG: hypothetical protein ACRDQ5_25850 [Sciscionella sp.]
MTITRWPGFNPDIDRTPDPLTFVDESVVTRAFAPPSLVTVNEPEPTDDTVPISSV